MAVPHDSGRRFWHIRLNWNYCARLLNLTLKVLNYGIDDEKQSIKKIEKNGNRKSPAKSPVGKRAA